MILPLQYLGMGSADFPLKDNRFNRLFYQKTAVESVRSFFSVQERYSHKPHSDLQSSWLP